MDIDNKYGALMSQQTLLAMMKDTHSFLMKHNITYSLEGGSLLGAIRENGFIPWDDDIDIVMDRENFERFLLIKDSMTGYVVSRMLWEYRIQRKKDYNGSLTGPTIDIVVMDKVPTSRIMQKMKVLIIKFLQGTMRRHKNYRDKNYPFIKRASLFITYYFGKLFSDETKFKWYDKVSQIGRNDNAKSLAIYDTLFKYLQFTYKINSMSDIMTHKFEDTEFLITYEYDDYLKTTYGEDYMTPPPQDERRPQHS